MQPYLSFETDRLILRPSNLDDAAFQLELMNTPKWLDYIGGRDIKTIEDAETYIKEKIISQFERVGFGNYVAIRKARGMKIGACGLYDRPELEGVDIGFAFLPEYEHSGYGVESARRIKSAAIEDFGITSLKAITIERNVGSQRLLEKIGLKFEKYIRLPNDAEELMLYFGDFSDENEANWNGTSNSSPIYNAGRWGILPDERVSEYTADGGVQSYSEVERRIQEDVLGDYAKHGYGRFAVEEKSTGELIGFSGLKYLEDIDEVDLGYRFISST